MADPVWTLLGFAATGATSAGTIPCTLTAAQPAGTILVAFVSCGSSLINLTSVVDSRNGASWQADAVGPTVNRKEFADSYKPPSLLQIGDTVTATFSGSTTDRNIQIFAVSNLDQTTWFAGSGTASGTSATPSATVAGLSAGSSYGVALLVCFNTAGGTMAAGTDGHGGALTILKETTSGSSFHLASEAGLAVTGQTSYAPTGSVSSVPYAALALAYNIAAGATLFSRTATDTALSMSGDTVAMTAGRAQPTDTALTVSSTLAMRATRALTDTALSPSDSLVRRAGRILTDTALAVTDAIAIRAGRARTDTVLAVTDTLAVLAARKLTDTALAVADALVGGRAFFRTAADTALTVTATLAAAARRIVADTALAVTEALSRRVSTSLTDTALTPGDTIAAARGRAAAIAGTALTAGDALTRRLGVFRTTTDQALTVSDVLVGVGHLSVHPAKLVLADRSAYRLDLSDRTETTLTLADRPGTAVTLTAHAAAGLDLSDRRGDTLDLADGSTL